MEIKKHGDNKVKLTIAVAIIIFVGTLFGALGYLLGVKNNNVVIKSEDQLIKTHDNDQNIKIEEEEINNKEKDEMENKKDEIADWNIYKNENLGIKFKYPQEAEIVLEKENEIRINLPIISEQYVSEKYLLVNKKYTDEECSNPLFTRIGKTETVTINSVDFVKETGGGAAAGSTYYSVSYSTLKNNWCTSLSFVVRSHSYKVDKNEEYAIFDQIISTLELIKSSNETANLKVYNGNMINKNGKSFSFNYSSELWILNNNGLLSNKKPDSCEFSPGGLFRQGMSNIIETKKMYFGNYEARKTELGNDTDGVLRINVYFDIDLSSEFSLSLPKNENDKQTCENDFDTILSTINFL